MLAVLDTSTMDNAPPGLRLAMLGDGDQWAGWVRRGRERWRQVCTGPTSDAVWEVLLSGRYGDHVDMLVLEIGIDPNLRPVPRRPVRKTARTGH